MESTLARLFSSDGLLGQTAGPALTTERRGLGDLFGGFLLKRDAADMDGFRQRLREASYLGWRNWWLEAAFWDRGGKMVGKPLYHLLQERPETVISVSTYAPSGSLKPLGEHLAWVKEVRRLGFSALKLRVKYATLEEELALVRGVRSAVGEDLVIGVDAIQGWRMAAFAPNPAWDMERAGAFGKGCGELGIAWLEEPWDRHDRVGMAALRTRIATPWRAASCTVAGMNCNRCSTTAASISISPMPCSLASPWRGG